MGLERHEVFYGTKNRKLSIKYGCVEYLSHDEHNEPPNGIHHNWKKDLALKQKHQKILEDKGMTREEFMQIFGENYIGREI